jgi:hypothetical protein
VSRYAARLVIWFIDGHANQPVCGLTLAWFCCIGRGFYHGSVVLVPQSCSHLVPPLQEGFCQQAQPALQRLQRSDHRRSV